MIKNEPLYNAIKNNPNEVWTLYENMFANIMHKIAYQKNFDYNELMSEAYIYFLGYCEEYDPNYNGGFIPFIAYILKNLTRRMYAYCQQERFKITRGNTMDLLEEMLDDENNVINLFKPAKMPEIEDVEFKFEKDRFYTYLSDREQNMVELSLAGYKQQEIKKILNTTQSCVSLGFKDIRKIYDEVYNNDISIERHEKLIKSKNFKNRYIAGRKKRNN